MNKRQLFIILYFIILGQIAIIIQFNKTNNIFGVCSSNISKFDSSKSTLSNYFNKLTYKNIGHILQGLF